MIISNNMKSKAMQEIIKQIILAKPSKKKISSIKKAIAKQYKLPKIPTDIEILLYANQSDMKKIKSYLQTKPGRTISGVTPVAVMTKPIKYRKPLQTN